MTNHEDPKDKLLSRLQTDWQQLDRLGSQPVPGKAIHQRTARDGQGREKEGFL